MSNYLFTYDSAHFEIQIRPPHLDRWIISPTKHDTFAEADKHLHSLVKHAVDNGDSGLQYRIVHRVATCEVTKHVTVRPLPAAVAARA